MKLSHSIHVWNMCLHYISHKSQQNVSIPYMDGMGMKKLASLAYPFIFFSISCLVVIAHHYERLRK